MHKAPISLIPLRAFADVFPFSPPNRPSPAYPSYPPPRRRAGPAPRSAAPPPPPRPSAPPWSCNGATTRLRTRARNDPRVHRAPLATHRRCDVAWTRRDEIAKRVVAKLRDQPLSRGSTRSSVAVPSWKRSRVHGSCVYHCRNHQSISYISCLSFAPYHFSLVLRDKIHSFLFHAGEGLQGKKKCCCSQKEVIFYRSHTLDFNPPLIILLIIAMCVGSIDYFLLIYAMRSAKLLVNLIIT